MSDYRPDDAPLRMQRLGLQALLDLAAPGVPDPEAIWAWSAGPRQIWESCARAAARGRLFVLRDADGATPRLLCVLDEQPALGWASADAAWYLGPVVALQPGALQLRFAVLAWAEQQARAAGVRWLRLPVPEAALDDLRRLQARGVWPRRRLPDGGVLLHQRWLEGDRDDASAWLDAPPDPGAFPDAEQATLLFVIRAGRMLLMRKKRGHGAGRVNAPGGKVEPDETPLQCALRETREELGIEARHVRWMGDLRFVDSAGWRIHGHVFRASAYRGTPVETDEGDPFWIGLDAVPFARMWPDDLVWLPWLMRGRRFAARFRFADEVLLDARLRLDAAALAGLESGACEHCPVSGTRR